VRMPTSFQVGDRRCRRSRPRGCRRCRFICISESASARVASGPMVMGLTTMPLSKLFTGADMFGLYRGIEVLVDHAEATSLRHGNRHAAFGDGIHRCTDDRDVQRDIARRAVRISTLAGSTSECAGCSSTSSKVRALSPVMEVTIFAKGCPSILAVRKAEAREAGATSSPASGLAEGRWQRPRILQSLSPQGTRAAAAWLALRRGRAPRGRIHPRCARPAFQSGGSSRCFGLPS